MAEKIKCALRASKVAAEETMKKPPIMKIIGGYFLAVVVLVLSYYVAWVYECFTNKVALSELLSLIKELIAPAAVAFVTFIVTCCVDKDGNGIPDSMEKGNET